MSDGRAHQRAASVALAAGAMGLGLVYSLLGAERDVFEPGLVGVLGGLVCGWILTPDLDVDGATIEETRLKRIPIIGWGLYVVFRGIFAPYAILMPHRSAFSHGIGLGTLIRMAYVSLIIYAIARVWIWTLLPPWVLIGVFVGWAIQDIIHWVLDML